MIHVGLIHDNLPGLLNHPSIVHKTQMILLYAYDQYDLTTNINNMQRLPNQQTMEYVKTRFSPTNYQC